jgi:hypothetical protein
MIRCFLRDLRFLSYFLFVRRDKLFRGVHNGDAPGAVADFDATQFFARF